MIPAILIPIIANIGEKIFDKLVKDPAVPVAPSDRIVVQPTIEKAVKEEVAPVIQDLTNTEPWYKSNVTLGAIASMLSGVLALLGYSIGAEELLPILIGIGFVVGPIWTLYGRWAGRNAALKRLGVK